MKIAIVDYGTGNLRSVGQAVRAVADGADVTVTKSAAEIDAADRVIFPGQGAMGDCMRCLGESGLKEAVLRALANKPVLAVCIGMQMLFERSDENDCAGLGLMAGEGGGQSHSFPASSLGACQRRAAQGASNGMEHCHAAHDASFVGRYCR